MTAGREIYMRVTRFEVSVWPDDVRNEPSSAMDATTWAVTVEERGLDRWAVMRGSGCLSRDGKWDFEPLPSSRDDDWLASHRLSMNEAQMLAVEQAPKVTVNGLTALQVLARHMPAPGEAS